MGSVTEFSYPKREVITRSGGRKAEVGLYNKTSHYTWIVFFVSDEV